MKGGIFIIVLLSVLMGHKVMGQIVAEEMYDHVPFFKCMECDPNIEPWIDPDGIYNGEEVEAQITSPISCVDRSAFTPSSTGNNSDNDDDLFIEYKKTMLDIEGTPFPDGENAVIVNLNQEFLVHFRHFGNKENRDEEGDLWLFVGRMTDYGAGKVDYTKETIDLNYETTNPIDDYYYNGGYRFNLTNQSHSSTHKLKFDKPGLYFIFAYVNFDGTLKLRRVAGWVMVRPEVKNTRYSACYVGPDAQCPDDYCDCVDVMPNEGAEDTDYYGTDGGYYQAKVKRDNLAGIANSYYNFYNQTLWFNATNVDDYKTQADAVLLIRNDSPDAGGLPIKAKEIEQQIKYRLANRDDLETYEEYIYMQVLDHGLQSVPTQLQIKRNLVPLPLYDYRLDCFGHEINLVNQTQFFSSAPEYIKYVWHFGDGRKEEKDVNRKPDDKPDQRFWDDHNGYEYINQGDYVPVLEVQYSYDEELCGIRSVFSKKENIEAEKLHDDYPLGSILGNNNVSQLVMDPDGIERTFPKVAVSLPIYVRSLQLSETVPAYKSYEITNVLGASAASFSDSWVMDLGGEMTSEEQTNLIRNLNPFVNGQKGLWRGSGTSTYIKDRIGAQSLKDNEAVDMKNSGSFTLESFNWKADHGPNWVKAQTITEYSPYGSEIENKDAINRYSTALFGYNGELATAVGANMRYREMAFTSFEEEFNKGNGQSSGFKQVNAGNFNIINTSTVRLKSVDVLGGKQQVAIIDYPFLQIDELKNGNFNLTLSGHNIVDGGAFTLDNMKISCKFRNMEASEQSIVRFNGAGLDALKNSWRGKLTYYESVDGTPVDESVAKVVDESDESLDNFKAHTGTRCLWVRQDFTQTQHFLDLEAGKEYVISAWVKVTGLGKFEATYGAPENDSNKLGIAIKLDDEKVATIEPSGTIIEGWQRLEGKFTYQAGKEIALTFQKGLHTDKEVYFDDIRLFPNLGNMQSYVYERGTYKLMATLDNNNFATLYHYDLAGNLFLIKKETIEGVKTIQESVSHQRGTDEIDSEDEN